MSDLFRRIFLSPAGLVLVFIIGCHGFGDGGAGSEVQILDLVIGRGAAVAEGDFVTIHFHCRPMKDSRQSGPIETSRTSDCPFVYQVGSGRVPVGWDQGIVGMKVGGRRRLAIPPHLGYGEEKAGCIAPSSTLILEIELLALPRVEIEYLCRGRGRIVETGDTVELDYQAWLTTQGRRGEVFDSTEQRGHKAVFTVGKGLVVPAWDQALPGLRLGDRVRLLVPSDLGFGLAGLSSGDSVIVASGVDLIYEIEVTGVRSGS